jgi:asparagine synthase (glutamine-hydrolysing)
MSGIAGIVLLRGGSRDPGDIVRMTGAMACRGPDGRGHWQEGPVALGHCLLRTTEEAADEAQPLVSRDGQIVLVFDGLLLNAAELRSALVQAGVQPQSRADSALVLGAYEAWGRACLDRIEGHFALAIWDGRRRELFCARDRLGTRPFHYHYAAGQMFCFASDPEALLALPDVPRQLNEARIADVLVSGLEGFDAECTFYTAIRRLPPAHSLTVSSAGLVMNRYWSFQPPPILRLKSDADYEDALRAVLTEAVRCRLRGGATTGAMLSGGVDSGSVVAIARRLKREAGGPPLATFSAVSPDPETCKETRAVLATAGIGDLDPHFVDHTALGDLTPDLIDLTLNLSSPFNQHMTLIRAVYLSAHRAGCKAVLDGMGGDNVMGDGGALAYLVRRGRVGKAWREARGPDLIFPRHEAVSSMGEAIRMAIAPDWVRSLRRSFGPRRVFGREAIEASFIKPEFAARVGVEDRFADHQARRLAPFRPGSPEQRARGIFQPRVTAARERYEREAARLQIEPRDPYHDLRVISFCVSLPVEQLRRDGWPKSVLRRAMANELPAEVLWRNTRTHLGWKFTQAVVRAASERAPLVSRSEIEAISSYIDMARFDADLADYRAGRDMETKRKQALFLVIHLAHWLATRPG